MHDEYEEMLLCIGQAGIPVRLVRLTFSLEIVVLILCLRAYAAARAKFVVPARCRWQRHGLDAHHIKPLKDQDTRRGAELLSSIAVLLCGARSAFELANAAIVRIRII